MATTHFQYDKLLEFFKAIDKSLSEPVVLCLIGSSVTILMGQQERSTEDIDVWLQASEFNFQIITKSVEEAGFLFDPREDFPEKGFVQIVRPGIVQVPGWDRYARKWLGKDPGILWKGDFLTVTSPPPESLVVSKLIRFNERDIEDCIWLLENFNIDNSDVLEALNLLPNSVKSHAEDNWNHLKALLQWNPSP